MTPIPDAGTFPFNVIVPLVVPPAATFIGLNESEITTGGTTVRPPPADVPLGVWEAVTVTGVLAATGDVVTLKVLLVAGPVMVNGLGIGMGVAAPDVLVKLKVMPPAGAGPFNTTVPTEALPPVTVAGLNVNDEITGGFTVKVPIWLLVPAVAVTTTGAAAATPTVVAVKVWVVLVAGTVMVPGTVTTDVFALLKVMLIPPVGAA